MKLTPPQLRAVICGLVTQSDIEYNTSADDDFRIKGGDTPVLVFVPSYFLENQYWSSRDEAMTAIHDLLAAAGITAVCTALEDSEICFTIEVSELPDDYQIPETEEGIDDLQEFTGDEVDWHIPDSEEESSDVDDDPDTTADEEELEDEDEDLDPDDFDEPHGSGLDG